MQEDYESIRTQLTVSKFKSLGKCQRPIADVAENSSGRLQ